MATVAARAATLALAMYASQTRSRLFARPSIGIVKRHLTPIMKYSLPAAFSSLAAPVGMAILTRYIARFGPEAVAGMAVVGRLYPVVFSVVNALSGSMGPIIGQNYGAGKIDRVRQAYFDAIKFLSLYVVLAALMLLMFRGFIGNAFGLEGLSRDLLYLFCGPLAIVAFFNGSIFVSNAVFTNIGKPRYPVWLSWGRSTLGILPFADLGSRIWGAQGVFVGVTMGGAVFAAIAVTIALKSIDRTAVKAAAQPVTEDASTTQEMMHHGRPWQG